MKIRTIVGFEGHFRYGRSEAECIRRLAAQHLETGPVLGRVTLAARWYLLEKEAPAPQRPAVVARELRKLDAACTLVVERIGALSNDARDELFVWALHDRRAWASTDSLRALQDIAMSVGEFAAQTADRMVTDRGVSRYRPRDVDRRFRNRLVQIWCDYGGPLLPFSRDLVQEGEPFRGPLADFLRACMRPVIPASEKGTELDNLFEELRRARVREGS